jgi:sugar phosphate permease
MNLAFAISEVYRGISSPFQLAAMVGAGSHVNLMMEIIGEIVGAIFGAFICGFFTILSVKISKSKRALPWILGYTSIALCLVSFFFSRLALRYVMIKYRITDSG